MATKEEPDFGSANLFDSRFSYGECPMQTSENFFMCRRQGQFPAGLWAVLYTCQSIGKVLLIGIIAQAI